MAEKRVSVRLVVEGGRVVRAEMDGLGASGERAFNRIERSGDAVAGMMRRVAGLFAAGFSLHAIGRAAERFNVMENSLRALGMTQEQVGDTLERLNQIAANTGAPIEAVTALYQRVSMASEELGVSQSELFRFVETTSAALAVQGGSAAAAQGALLQLGQALGGGIVRAEEWNSILEGTPALARAAADGWGAAGVTVGELGRLIREGVVSSRDLFDAISSQSDALAQALANTETTVGRALAEMDRSLVSFVGEMDNAFRVSERVAQGIIAVAQNLDAVAAVATGLAATALPSLASGFRAVGMAAMVAGGPISLVIGLVAAGASYFLLFRDNADEVPPALRAVTEAQDTLNTALGTFATNGAPEAGRQALAYARNLESQALAAIAAAEAELVLAQAEQERRLAAMPFARQQFERGELGDIPEVTEAEERISTMRETLEGARRTIAALTLEMAAPPMAATEALANTGAAAEAVTEAITRAGAASREASQAALVGWQSVSAELARYATAASDVAAQTSSLLTGSMKRLEDALVNAFVDGRGAASAFFSYIAQEVARMAIRQTVIAPLSNFLSRTLGGIFGGASVSVMHTGGLVGAGGVSRVVDPAIFAAAPRYHQGGIAGLMPGEVPAILQEGERVIPRGAGGGGPLELQIAVRVLEDGGLQAFVEKTSNNITTRHVQKGLAAYDKALPARVRNMNPRRA